MWTIRDGNAPPGHRTIRIDLRCVFKRADRLVVVERIEEAEALIKKPLGLGQCRGDFAAKAAKAVVQRRLFSRFSRIAVACRANCSEPDNGQRKSHRSLHS